MANYYGPLANQLSTERSFCAEILKRNGLRRLPGRDISISSSEEELSSGILTELMENLIQTIQAIHM